MDRRSFLVAGGATMLGAGLARAHAPPMRFARPRPTASQLAWQRDELAMFLHFGVNTFSNREWGDGKEDPRSFDPAHLDARQWARTARAAGFRAMILTAKHHDGFCLWPTSTTQHSVASSPFRNGSGDVVREFVDACRAEGLRAGLYLSPWDRNNPAYGDSARYNDLYYTQLTELLTRYGTINEVWFDGANGEGPNGKRQVYDWPTTWALVRKLQPEAVMFSDSGPDVRWCGNEAGRGGDPNWSTVDPSIVSFPGASGADVSSALQHGHADGAVWRPAEMDVSIRPGWFYHPAEDAKVRTIDNLVDLYFSSVGRNGKLLLNVPPTRDGLIHPVDIERLTAFAQRKSQLFEHDVAERAAVSAMPNGRIIDLGREMSISVARLEEDISKGQAVSRYSLYGAPRNSENWTPMAAGSTIGYAKLDRFTPVTVQHVKLVIDQTLDASPPVQLKLYA